MVLGMEIDLHFLHAPRPGPTVEPDWIDEWDGRLWCVDDYVDGLFDTAAGPTIRHEVIQQRDAEPRRAPPPHGAPALEVG